MKAQANLQLGRFEEAIKQANAVHQLSHANWASVHVIAAQAYERMNQPELARVQYETYVRESPKGGLGVVVSQRMQQLDAPTGKESTANSVPPINSLLPR
jgi:tetratricopeptide (TPR) repeat protein